MVSPDDPGALAAALEGVLAGRMRTDTNSAQRWARQFEIERVAGLYERTYVDLLVGARPGLAA